MKTFASLIAFFAFVFLTHAAGSLLIKDGKLQSDLNAGGHAITNATDLIDANGNSLLGAGPGGGISLIQGSNIVNVAGGVIVTNANTTFKFSSQGTNDIEAIGDARYDLLTTALAREANFENFTNSVGSAAFQPASAFDAACAASAATNAFFETTITNGSTAAVIQAAVNGLVNGGVLNIQPGSYTISSPIIITNSIVIQGNAATFAYALGQSGFMLDTTTNYQKRLIVDNLIFDGQIPENYNTTNYTSMFNGSLDPFYSAFWTNRSGLRVECSGGVIVKNCTFKNWSGNGCLAMQLGGTLGAQSQRKFQFINNRCFTNYLGLCVPGAAFEVPGFGGAASGSWLDATAEYGMIEGNDIFNNQIGLLAGAGNLVVHGNTINANWHGVDLFTGGNPGHGNYTGNTINHNYFAIYTESTSGGLWQNNQMLANTAIVFNNTIDLTFKHNSLGQTGLTATNHCSATFADNVYQSGALWGSTSPGTLFPTNINAGILVYGNMDTVGTNTDGSMVSVLAHSTNSAVVGGFAYTPDGANAAWTLNGSSLTNLSPAVATNNAAASDGWVLSRTGNNLKLIPASGAGTVTSVGLAVPQGFSASGSPVTGSGTLTITRNGGDDNYLGGGATNLNKTWTTNLEVDTMTGVSGGTIEQKTAPRGRLSICIRVSPTRAITSVFRAGLIPLEIISRQRKAVAPAQTPATGISKSPGATACDSGRMNWNAGA